jgi:hypothetical protein
MLHSCKLEIEEKIQKRAAQAALFHGRPKTPKENQSASAAEETLCNSSQGKMP